MMKKSRGDFEGVDQAEGSQSAEHDGNRRKRQKITASEQLSELLQTRIFSHELHLAAISVLEELKEKEWALAQREHQMQQEIDRLNHSKFEAERRKDFLESFSRRILCPWKLKFIMESFANNYLPENHDLIIQRISVIDEKLLDATDMGPQLRVEKRKKTLVFVRQLLHLSLQEQADNSFLNIWISMKRIPYQVQPDVAEIIRNNNLSSAFIHLYQAANEIEAIQIFNNQKCKVWQRRNKMLSASDTEALEALSCISVDDILDSIRRAGLQLEPVEALYARDSFEIGPSFVKAENKQYKRCRFVLMTNDHPAIIEICCKLELRWPGHKRSQRLHWYSSAYARLFDIVSGQDLFGPSFEPPFSNLNPATEEFRQYIQFLEVSQSSDIAFVAETLCIP